MLLQDSFPDGLASKPPLAISGVWRRARSKHADTNSSINSGGKDPYTKAPNATARPLNAAALLVCCEYEQDAAVKSCSRCRAHTAITDRVPALHDCCAQVSGRPPFNLQHCSSSTCAVGLPRRLALGATDSLASVLYCCTDPRRHDLQASNLEGNGAQLRRLGFRVANAPDRGWDQEGR
jgi:hypothetical protein